MFQIIQYLASYLSKTKHFKRFKNYLDTNLSTKGWCKKKYTKTFVSSNFYTYIMVFLLDFKNHTHFKLSYELLKVSVGHLSLDLHQFYYNTYFHKFLYFVKNNFTKSWNKNKHSFECKKGAKIGLKPVFCWFLHFVPWTE